MHYKKNYILLLISFTNLCFGILILIYDQISKLIPLYIILYIINASLSCASLLVSHSKLDMIYISLGIILGWISIWISICIVSHIIPMFHNSSFIIASLAFGATICFMLAFFNILFTRIPQPIPDSIVPETNYPKTKKVHFADTLWIPINEIQDIECATNV